MKPKNCGKFEAASAVWFRSSPETSSGKANTAEKGLSMPNLSTTAAPSVPPKKVSAKNAIATGAIGGGVLVDHVGALGGPLFAVVAMTLGALLTLRYGPRGSTPITVSGH